MLNLKIEFHIHIHSVYDQKKETLFVLFTQHVYRTVDFKLNLYLKTKKNISKQQKME